MPRGITKDYKCGWCLYEFKKEVVYSGESKKGGVSSMVVCPNCVRLIPTWRREETGNIVGRIHLHPDRR